MTIDAEYFRKLLQTFLNTNEPDLSGDTILIEKKSEVAFKLYCSLAKQDKSAALEMAKIKLFEGLEFSIYYFVLELICRYFNRIPDRNIHQICQNILPQCVEIYNHFSFDEEKTLEDDYYNMVAAIQKIIRQYSEKNGDDL